MILAHLLYKGGLRNKKGVLDPCFHDIVAVMVHLSTVCSIQCNSVM